MSGRRLIQNDGMLGGLAVDVSQHHSGKLSTVAGLSSATHALQVVGEDGRRVHCACRGGPAYLILTELSMGSISDKTSQSLPSCRTHAAGRHHPATAAAISAASNTGRSDRTDTVPRGSPFLHFPPEGEPSAQISFTWPASSSSSPSPCASAAGGGDEALTSAASLITIPSRLPRRPIAPTPHHSAHKYHELNRIDSN